MDADYFPQSLQTRAKIGVPKKASDEQRGFVRADVQPGQAIPLVTQFRLKEIEIAGKEGFNIRDEEPGIGGLRNYGLAVLSQIQVDLGEEKEAIEVAKAQGEALLRTQALVRIAKTLMKIE